MAYDLPIALERLVATERILASDDWGPSAQSDSPYAEFAAGWRGQSPVPTDAELQAAYDEVLPINAALTNTRQREDAVDSINISPQSIGKVLRAEAAVLVDELNSLRQWIESFKSEVAATSSLANFQTRVAGLPNMPDRTLAQAKTAIINKINSGVVD